MYRKQLQCTDKQPVHAVLNGFGDQFSEICFRRSVSGEPHLPERVGREQDVGDELARGARVSARTRTARSAARRTVRVVAATNLERGEGRDDRRRREAVGAWRAALSI